MYEDSDEEDIEINKINKNIDSTIKVVGEQKTDEQTERISNASRDNDLSVKRIERSTTVINTKIFISIFL